MSGSTLLRRSLLGASAGAAALLMLAVLLAALLQAGWFRGPVIRFVGRHLARTVDVKGELHVHLFAVHPWMTAEGVTIGNPAWMPPGTTAEIGRLSLVIGLPWIGEPLTIDQLVMDDATMTLARNASGAANWQWTDPRFPDDSAPLLIRDLSAPTAHLTLKDAIRHLDFSGTVSIDAPRPATTQIRLREPLAVSAGPRLRLAAAGQLNGHAVRITLDGDSLAAAQHDKPYRFNFSEQSSGTTVTGQGELPQPFDVRLVDAAFEASGENLRDLYFLTGVTLVDTGTYRLTGHVSRRGLHSEFTELAVVSGQSEVHGRIEIDSRGVRPIFHVELDAPRLRLADLGARASGRDPNDTANLRLMLSAAALNPAAWRRSDVVATVHASRLDLGPLPIRDLAAVIDIDHGILTARPLTGHLFGGGLTADARIDLNLDDPPGSVDLKVAGLHLEQYVPKGKTDPAADGLVHIRITASGHGSSVHAFASTADGTLSAAVLQGRIRASLVDVAALDMSALGLSLDKHRRETPIRCGVADFRAHAGVLTAQTLVLDTAVALIAGDGTIRMDTEALDLRLHGHPKAPQLFRVRSPVVVRGTLLHPSFALEPGNAVAQTASAVALGVLLTPLASILAFVDPGLAKDADCAALLAQLPTP